MKSLLAKSFVFAIWLSIFGLFAPTVFTQTDSSVNLNDVLERQKQNAPKDLNPNLIKVNKRQPLPFKPFEMRDPETGAEISPEVVLTLPDGKQAKAGEYYNTLNEIERGLNELGYSLREDWESITLQESIVDDTALKSQARLIRATVDENKPFSVRSFDEFNRDAMQPQPERASDSLKVFKPPINVIAVPGGTKENTKIGGVAPRIGQSTVDLINSINVPKKPIVTRTVKEYPYSFGDPNLFSGSVNGKLDLNGSEEKMTLLGEAKAGASIFGITADVLRLTGSVNAPNKGNMTGKVTLDVLPLGTVYSLSLNGASISKEDGATKTLDANFANFRVMIGPVPVQVKAGARGDAGFRYYAGLNPTSAAAEFTPFVHSRVYVQAGVDVGVAGAGAGAEMTLLNYDLAMSGSIRLWAQIPEGQTKQMLGIREQYKISNKLEMLNGSAYAYAYIYVPKFGIPPWKKKEWRWDIWKWNGFTPINGELVNETRWTSLGIPTK